MSKKSGGFTLIELLLSSALSLFIFVGVTSSLMQGIRIFERLRNVDDEQEAAIFLERLTRDLKNSMTYTSVPFLVSDAQDTVSFASLVLRGDEDDSLSQAMPMRVVYAYDKESKTIFRADIPPTGKENTVTKKEGVLSGITSVKFTVWPEGSGAPKKVTVEFTCGDPARPRSIRKDIMIPAAQW